MWKTRQMFHWRKTNLAAKLAWGSIWNFPHLLQLSILCWEKDPFLQVSTQHRDCLVCALIDWLGSHVVNSMHEELKTLQPCLSLRNISLDFVLLLIPGLIRGLNQAKHRRAGPGSPSIYLWKKNDCLCSLRWVINSRLLMQNKQQFFPLTLQFAVSQTFPRPFFHFFKTIHERI